MSIFSNMREVLGTAGSRLFLHEKVHDKVLEKVIENAKKIKLGDQMDPSTTMGPLISAKQKERVTGLYRQRQVRRQARAFDRRPERFGERPLCRADHLRRRAKLDEDRARGNLRPGALGAHLQGRRRSAGAGKRLPLRARRIRNHA